MINIPCEGDISLTEIYEREIVALSTKENNVTMLDDISDEDAVYPFEVKMDKFFQ